MSRKGRDIRSHRSTESGPMRASRAQRVAEQIQHFLGMYFIEGNVKDDRIDALAAAGHSLTVSFVRLSDDLKEAKVFVQLLGQGAVPKGCLEALNENAFRIKKEIAEQLQLRYTPQLRFMEDEDFEKSLRLVKLINDVKSKQ